MKVSNLIVLSICRLICDKRTHLLKRQRQKLLAQKKRPAFWPDVFSTLHQFSDYAWHQLAAWEFSLRAAARIPAPST